MNIALGYAFTAKEIFEFFPANKLKTKNIDFFFGLLTHHKREVASRIFARAVEVVINDIVRNNTEFVLPCTYKSRVVLFIKRFTGLLFIEARMDGKWRDIDFISSDFTGYQIYYRSETQSGKVVESPVYVSMYYKDMLTQLANECKPLKSPDIKNVKDYLPVMKELYPKILEKDLKQILVYGWRLIYLHKVKNLDVTIGHLNFKCFFGRLFKPKLFFYRIYANKMSRKLRYYFNKRELEWDGYYYFGLSKKQYEEYLAAKKYGRSRKTWYNFTNLSLYKLFDECNIKHPWYVAIFRVPMSFEREFVIFLEHARIKLPELILERDSLKLKDILKNNHYYEILDKSKAKLKK